MSKILEEVRVAANPISQGIAVGLLYVLKDDEEWRVPEFTIFAHQVQEEIERYRRALHHSRLEIERLIDSLALEGSHEAVTILATHLTMLSDPVITYEVEEKISTRLKNPETVFLHEMEVYVKALTSCLNSDIKQSSLDIKDLITRVLRHLDPSSSFAAHEIPFQSILCASQLVPSQTAEASPHQVRAFVTEFGGPTSHAALIAKAKGIPYLSNVKVKEIEEWSGVKAIVDGNSGVLILNPSHETLREYSEGRERRLASRSSAHQIFSAVDETLDGKKIEVQANLENLHDLYLLRDLKTQSIGLIRSEFLYLKKDLHSFCENEQYELYKKLMQLSGKMDVTFRIFDIGSDKQFIKKMAAEPNPALGCRSIRFLMRYPEIFSTQIRAILRAAVFGKMKLLLPLISDLDELREAKNFIEQVKLQLDREGINYCKQIPIGCMVEVPAFVIMCDQLVKECDFLSIGTNDLAQYTFAADRSNPHTCNKYRYDHPALVRMIKKVVDEGAKGGIEVSVCGEIASDPTQTELLIGLGVTKFSCSPRFIPIIKEAISRVHYSAAKEKADLKYGF